jgi:hypothetical protein
MQRRVVVLKDGQIVSDDRGVGYEKAEEAR